MLFRRTLFSLSIGLIVLVISTSAEAQNWPQWRGPLGTGHSSDTRLPTSWDKTNVDWQVELGGIGQSSPVVWGDRIYLTTSSKDGKQRSVVCLDRNSGKEIWRKSSPVEVPEDLHNMNTFASATCATDGERVIAFFGRGGIHCYDMDGKNLWSSDLAKFDSRWGTAASPVIVGDIVVQNCDADDAAFLIGLDKQTGKQVWKTKRETVRGWSTPVLIEAPQRKELVINGHSGINSYDPKTGKQLWYVDGGGGRGAPTVVPALDFVVAVSGRPGDMIAVRPGGSGKVNDTHEVWRTSRRAGRDLPSPIVIGKYLFVINLRPGVAYCYDVASGKELWKERLEGSFSSSPIAAGGLIYIPNEEGTTFVVRLGEKFDLVSKSTVGNSADEIFRAAVTPHNGQLLIRSDKILYCVGKKNSQ